jgi:hypothetical protein
MSEFDFLPALNDSGTGAANPMLDGLRGTIDQNGRLDPWALLQSQLAAQTASDPRTALLLQFLQQRRGAVKAEAASDEAAAMAETDGFRREEAARGEWGNVTSGISERLHNLHAEVEALQHRNDEFAAAVGACFLCFGDDPNCVECGGLGAPGSRAPEPAAYRKIVLPAVRRAQRIAGRKHEDPIRSSRGAVSQAATPTPQLGGP